MTREAFAARIHWGKIIWLFGFVNVGAMLPQLFSLVRTHETKGINIWTFVLFGIIQVAFSLQGFFRRDHMLMWCMGLSAAVSGTIIALVEIYR
ncbi:MAG TPA: hypothetical protein VEZ11_14295 [Thermoanaerobaculia bacterium]|nr:hypothetical protein [Thermoanaerobaculia bacterium]